MGTELGTALTDLGVDDINATSVNVGAGTGITINAVALGDYSSFETALNAKLAE